MARVALVLAALVALTPLIVMGCVHEYGTVQEAHVSVYLCGPAAEAVQQHVHGCSCVHVLPLPYHTEMSFSPVECIQALLCANQHHAISSPGAEQQCDQQLQTMCRCTCTCSRCTNNFLHCMLWPECRRQLEHTSPMGESQLHPNLQQIQEQQTCMTMSLRDMLACEMRLRSCLVLVSSDA